MITHNVPPKRNPYAVSSRPPSPPPLTPWQPLICFLSLWICLFWTFYVDGVTQYVVLCIWLLASRFRGHPRCRVLLRTSQGDVSSLADDVNPSPPGLRPGVPGVTALGSCTVASSRFYLCLPDHDLVVRMEQFPSCLLHSRRKPESSSVCQCSHCGHLQCLQE